MTYLEIFEQRIRPRITVTSRGCWETSFAPNNNSYKSVTVRPNRWLVHRVSYIAHKGIILEGLNVLHTCDNPGCCNPEHLKLGTQKENLQDMDSKGRRGVWHPFDDLNPSRRPEVRKTLSKLADKRKRDSDGRFT